MTTPKPSAKTFREPVLRAMGVLTGLSTTPSIHSSDVIEAVLVATGVALDAHGNDTGGRSKVKIWIIGAFNKILAKKEGLGCSLKRGHWSLTAEGVEAARILLEATPEDTPEVVPEVIPEATPEVSAPEVSAPEVSAPEIPQGGGVSWDGLGAQVNTYNADPYIRGLAVEQTACFGEHSTTSKLCGTCSLAGACKAMVLTRVSTIAARLTLRDERAAAVVLELARHPHSDAPAPASNMDAEEDVDDIVGIIEADDDLSEDITEEGVDLGNDFQSIKLPSDTLCRSCNVNMPMGDMAAWKRGDGMYHLKCQP